VLGEEIFLDIFWGFR